MSEEQYLNNKYKKWDNFKDDSDSEGDDVPRKPTQFDVEGEDDIVVSTEQLLTAQQVDKFKRLDKPHQEVWQVVVRKLRVWTASSEGADDGKDAIACRPYCILVNNLYPMGQVISKKICDPPEKYPSPQEILDVTLQAMLDPPTNTPQHRPDKICFPDKFYVGKLRKSYAAIGIECSYLSESQGIDAYISELSKQLVRKDLASVAEVSERPGSLTGDGVTVDVLKEFYAACAKYAAFEPWNRLAERQAIQIDAQEVIHIDKRHEVSRGTVFGSVVGTQTSQGQIQGMALFFTRADLERRVLPAGSELAYMENSELRRCGFCDKKAPKGSELKRCTRCKCVFYCGAECQRSHWKDHKVNCIPQSEVEEKQKDKKIVWGAKEMSILYGAETSLPFDDLDFVEKHGCEIASVRGEKLYPSPMTFKFGEPTIPTVSDLLWLTRGLLVHVELLSKHPLFMQVTMSSLLGLDDGDESEVPKIELTCKSLDLDDRLVIRNSTVLTMEDVTKLREYAATKKVEAEQAEAKAQATAEGATESSPLVGDEQQAAGGGTGADADGDQGKCVVM